MAAEISLKVKSDFAQAAADLKKFGDITEKETKRLERFAKSFDNKQADSFIDRNRRAAAAVQAVKGPLEGAQAGMRGLEREMQRLIRNGIDPQDESIEKLRMEYNRLAKETQKNIDAQKGMEQASKIATSGLVALGAATVAVVTAAVKGSAEIGKMGDEIAKTSARTGVSVEALQELSFAAERQGLSSGALSGVLQKLNKNIGDVRAGTGALTTLLKNNNPELLKQIEGAKNSEEAFKLMLEAIDAAPTQFDKAALAQAAFGRSGQEIINFAELGLKGIADLREEARQYGILSENLTKQGEAWVDAQRNLQQAWVGLRSEAAEKLLPIMTDLFNGFAAFISDTEKVKKTIDVLVPVLAGLTSGFAAFLIVTKGAAAVQAFAQAFRVLNAVIAANPIGFIATVIVTVLIPAIILLVKNWDKVVVFFQETTAIIKELLIDFIEETKKRWITQLNSIKIGFLELTQIILDKALGGVQKFLEAAGQIPFIGEKFQGLAEKVADVRGNMNDLIDATQQASRDTIQAAEDARAARAAESADNIARIRRESDARRAELDRQKAENEAAAEERAAAVQAQEEEVTEIMLDALKERLAALNNQEAIAMMQQKETFMKFLEARAEQENIFGEQRIEFYQAELERIMELENITGEERISAAEVVQGEINRIQEENSKARVELLRNEVSATGDLFGALSNIITAFGGKNREAAIAAKALSAAQAGINSALAFTQVIADPTIPTLLKVVTATGIALNGIAQQAKILSTPIPTAQTGSGSMGIEVAPVPGSSRTDNVRASAMVGPGEQFNVTPRGESPRGGQNINIVVGDEAIFKIVQRGIESRDIRITDADIQEAAG